jgi:hypothetical protein
LSLPVPEYGIPSNSCYWLYESLAMLNPTSRETPRASST